MGYKSPKDIWKIANRQLIEAEIEVEKKSNMNSYKACMNCKNSMIQSMNSYLLSREIMPSPVQTLHVLMEQCRQEDPEFVDIELEKINCRFEVVNEDHCTSQKDLKKCLDVTTSVNNITRL